MDKPNHPIRKKGTSYLKEFREEAVRYWLSSGKKATEVARELGVSDWSLHRWHKEMEQVSVPIPTENVQLNALELAKENGRLRRELEAMTQQREILKKAIPIFSAENPKGNLR
jgi:transposase